jgi:hypothetical protein
MEFKIKWEGEDYATRGAFFEGYEEFTLVRNAPDEDFDAGAVFLGNGVFVVAVPADLDDWVAYSVHMEAEPVTPAGIEAGLSLAVAFVEFQLHGENGYGTLAPWIQELKERIEFAETAGAV